MFIETVVWRDIELQRIEFIKTINMPYLRDFLIAVIKQRTEY